MEKRATISDRLGCSFRSSEAAKQTKNFLSFIFRLSAGGEGGAGRNWKEIFGFATRESASASEARSSAIRAYVLGSSHHALRACEVIGLFVQKRFAQMIVLGHIDRDVLLC